MSKCDRGFHSCCVALSVLAGLLTDLNDFVNFEKKSITLLQAYVVKRALF